ncbi:MAG: hypothetical protein COZ75_01685 [Flavobacteriaceae bacterium CG_4_8_14_3_um_filter_34_10]|nr:hypothetical protein [Flavobacteriia bacterium]OIP50340.1 MAG: hypothetical protein AUK33_07925 [Flavobacteriaceae bacterium CG2_30_34_30]PIQ18419.1 MAG: hypothetical protein COW66_06690 [Flavobacteriaceae bacterium CG18_big_fil_WC_8_21_14_2_50_34_36]PIX10449.1 MAG: hypothetical protein COZ75_01685 [Flavobacteriaceae bacterium CG_4_8_14_3_um_filter_34_10]PJC07828.1 MAG: hypothetical protein CO068_04270 [Flavobacteriaceae bacterium CG_4_9_14_0_8_um_filter_34_30]
MKHLTIIIFSLLLFSCKPEIKEVPVIVEKDEDLIELLSRMTGSFSTIKQAEKDSSYFSISLHMYPIWKEKEGNWLYVEQALYDKQEKPYRQRIYNISRENDSIFKSEIYTIPNQSLWICKWDTPEVFDKLLEESLLIRNGCDVFLKKTAENTFIGKTIGKACLSDLSGATYATSEVEINENNIISWDRGFNEKDSLVWGASKAGYVFDKL